MSPDTIFKVGDWIASLNVLGEPSPQRIIHLRSFNGSTFIGLIY